VLVLTMYVYYEAVVVCDGISLLIPIDEADSEQLIGMSLMEGYLLTVEARDGGQVELNKLKCNYRAKNEKYHC
jgi:hypothetical protein